MATFTVNGQTVSVEKNQKLIRFLRDELRLTSVKDGCSEGACGTCTIHVDGAAVKACVLTTALAAGRDIVTVEGLPEDVREVFTSVCAHRLVLRPQARIESITAEDVLDRILAAVPAPSMGQVRGRS